MRITLLSFLLAGVLAVTGFAQQDAPPQNVFAEMLEQMRSPAVQQGMKDGTKNVFRSFWDGRWTNLTALGLLKDPEIRTTLDVSDELFQQIQDVEKNALEQMLNAPEYQKAMEEMQNAMQTGDEEAMKRSVDTQTRMSLLEMDSLSDAINNILPSDLKQKMKEALLGSMGEIPIISPNMFEALDLTDTQKQQMERIKKELEPEFEKNLETFADGSTTMMIGQFEELAKQWRAGDSNDPKDIQEKSQAVQKKLLGDPAYKRIYDEVQSKGKTFASQFRIKMFDVLTDKQWDRLQELIDNPPEHVKVFRKKLKEKRGEAEKSSTYIPGPNSWRPGDPVPEEYRQKRNERRRRFPREE
jgi:Ni/Co efflux regulator RcnB